AEAVARAFALAKNGKTPLSQREELVGALGEVNQPAAVPVLLDLLTAKEPDSLRRAALTPLQAYNDDRIGGAVTKLYPQLTGGLREAAETLLVSRMGWSKQLLAAVAAGSIEPRSIPTATLKKILLHRDGEIDALVQKHWGEVKGAT